MDERTTAKLVSSVADFLRKILCIADDGNYDRDSFVKATADMLATMAEVSTFLEYQLEEDP